MFLQLDDWELVLRLSARLAVAMLLGVCIGLERARKHKDAGLRTHAMVALGAALFTTAAVEGKMTTSDLSRVIQGVAAGIGFLGAGTILKQSGVTNLIQTHETSLKQMNGANPSGGHRIEGLTTAASIWLTAAAGVSIGAGWFWPPVIAVVLALLVLTLGHSIENYVRGDE